MGTLYYGDNLDILRRYLKDETVDLVYLDAPFNSAQNYNAFFYEKDGTDAASQIRAISAASERRLWVGSERPIRRRPITALGAERKPMLKSAASGFAPNRTLVRLGKNARTGWIADPSPTFRERLLRRQGNGVFAVAFTTTIAPSRSGCVPTLGNGSWRLSVPTGGCLAQRGCAV